ncbi:MAG: M60 family metallopeptidase [Planctomycetaceae bacterium]|nr:M60 family metallopeptidase [Planctomycetaceae bacterium]
MPNSRPSFRILCCLASAISCQVANTANAAAPPRELFEGVDRITLPGVVGSLVVFGPEAFVVAAGPSGNSQLPLIAAGPLEKGRVVACGHNGYLSPGTLKHKSTGKLISNLMLWAANKTQDQAQRMKIGVVDDRGMADALRSAGLQVEALSGPSWSRSLNGLQLLLLSPRKLKGDEVDPVLKYVRQGGGLMMGDAGWVWEGYNAKPGEVLSQDFAGNRIGRHAGLMWSSRNIESPADKEVNVSASVAPALTAHSALDELSRLSGPSQSDAVTQAVVTLESTLSLLPREDALFRPELEQLLSQRLPEPALPRPRQAIKTSEIFARLQVANETRKVLDEPVDQLSAHPMADVFPSQPPKAARGVKRQITVNTEQPRWHSTGLYARSGDKITVTVPAKAAGQGLIVRIGAHKDRLWHKDQWQRAPEITREFRVDGATTIAGSGFGGLIYIDIPRDCKLGTIEVEIDGGIPAPRYVHGETSQADWRESRHFPAPWAELASSKFIITLPSEAIRELDRPNELMDYWDRVLDACADLATIPRERPYPERFVIDAQISAGYMHAGYPIMAPLNLAEEVTDLATLQKKGNWGVYHEIGHNHQEPEWTWDGLGEVTVNLFSMYLLDTLNPRAAHHGMVQPESLARLRGEFQQSGKLDGPWPQLVPYIELQRAFGWQPFKTVFAQYRELDAKDRPKTLQAKKDLWLILFSQAVRHNLGPFYDDWKIGMSDEAKAKVNALPAWMPPR